MKAVRFSQFRGSGGSGDRGSARAARRTGPGPDCCTRGRRQLKRLEEARRTMDRQLPQTLGYEAAGLVDEVGVGVMDVAIGNRVFGFCADGAAQAAHAVLSSLRSNSAERLVPLVAARGTSTCGWDGQARETRSIAGTLTGSRDGVRDGQAKSGTHGPARPRSPGWRTTGTGWRRCQRT
jgi:Alcohol dehydrogenase GroES-like domain